MPKWIRTERDYDDTDDDDDDDDADDDDDVDDDDYADCAAGNCLHARLQQFPKHDLCQDSLARSTRRRQQPQAPEGRLTLDPGLEGLQDVT